MKQFSFAEQKAIVHLSLGKDFDPAAKAWMDLFDGLADMQSDLLKPLANFKSDVKPNDLQAALKTLLKTMLKAMLKAQKNHSTKFFYLSQSESIS